MQKINTCEKKYGKIGSDLYMSNTVCMAQQTIYQKEKINLGEKIVNFNSDINKITNQNTDCLNNLTKTKINLRKNELEVLELRSAYRILEDDITISDDRLKDREKKLRNCRKPKEI